MCRLVRQYSFRGWLRGSTAAMWSGDSRPRNRANFSIVGCARASRMTRVFYASDLVPIYRRAHLAGERALRVLFAPNYASQLPHLRPANCGVARLFGTKSPSQNPLAASASRGRFPRYAFDFASSFTVCKLRSKIKTKP